MLLVMPNTNTEWYMPFVPYLFGATVTAIAGLVKMWADVRDLRRSSDRLEVSQTATMSKMEVEFTAKILEIKQEVHAQEADIRGLGGTLKGIQTYISWIRETLGKLTK